MPFDFKEYDAKCNGLSPEELQREWQHYTRLISGASTSTAISGMAVPFTLGVSTIGVAMAAPAIHNARKKREIIERHLQKHGTTHVTRKRDVLGSMAVSGTIGVVTLGVGSAGADALATTGAEHGISAIVENETAIKVVTHAALDGVGMGIEHAHTNHLKKKDAFKAFQAAGVFQAIQDEKAAGSGYSVQPYNPQDYAPGGSMAHYQPPPQYSHVSQTQPPPSYSANPNAAYLPDTKAPAECVLGQQAQQYMVPAYPVQHYATQHYGPAQAQGYNAGSSVASPPGPVLQPQQPQPTSQPHPPHPAQTTHNAQPAAASTIPQYPTQAVPPPPSQPASTYTPASTLQVPHNHIYQQPTHTPAPVYTYPPPPSPQPQHSYQPTTIPPPPSPQAQHSYQPTAVPPPPPPQPQHSYHPATVLPPPSHPPPATSPVDAHPAPQQVTPKTQYTMAPVPPRYDNMPNYTTYQKHLPAPVQQAYHPAPQPYKPQPQTQQQTQQQPYNPLPTPISPPYSPHAVAQGGPSYFPAMATTQYQPAYDPRSWNGRPQGQEPYTPAATPGTPYAQQVTQAYPSHQQQHGNGNVPTFPSTG